MKAERIGHGYRMMHDEKAYREYAINRRIHIEACPKSSVITGSVPLDWEQHPIKR
jgi:adenosine deaminase